MPTTSIAMFRGFKSWAGENFFTCRCSIALIRTYVYVFISRHKKTSRHVKFAYILNGSNAPSKRVTTYVILLHDIGVFMCLLGGFGVTAGVHRLWCHRSYKAKLPLRIFLIICYSIAGQVIIVFVLHERKLQKH